MPFDSVLSESSGRVKSGVISVPTSQLPGPIAIIDVETTGLFPQRHDRVIEVAAIVIDGRGRIAREFVTLVNPERDIGPTSIHGLTAVDTLHAPKFSDIAGILVEILQGTVAIAGHNVRFDLQFMESEFCRIGAPLPKCFSICTMQLAGGGRLAECCCDYGISEIGNSHHALADARATAALLSVLLPDQPRVVQQVCELMPIQWPTISRTERQPVTREDSRRRQTEPPTFLQRLLTRMHSGAESIASDGAVMAYAALLDRVLEDRRIDECEGEALCETATRWGLTGEQIRLTHRDYLNRLACAAVADGIVTDAERRDLKLVARLLGNEPRNLDEILNEAAAKVVEATSKQIAPTAAEATLTGKSVCFTGELQCCLNGQLISRELAEQLASDAGLNALDSVTKKLDILVIADPHSQSGKAKKARQYGIRIMHEPVFWKALGIEVS